MDFIEDLFDIADRKRRQKNGQFQKDTYHEDDHDDDHDDHDHGHTQRAQTNQNPTVPGSQAAFLAGIVCRRCSTQTVKGARYCHGCGSALQTAQNCAACGSKLPEDAPFCPQCGYRNG